MGEPYYYGRRPEPPKAPVDCLFRQFNLFCIKCQSHKLRLRVAVDDGEQKLVVYCPCCQITEGVPTNSRTAAKTNDYEI